MQRRQSPIQTVSLDVNVYNFKKLLFLLESDIRFTITTAGKGAGIKTLLSLEKRQYLRQY